MNNLINLDAINALDLSSIKNAALVKESESLAALQAKIKSGAAKLAGTVDAVQREQAIILNRIQATKLYEKDGFKSLKEYGEAIGLSKGAVYALSNAGKTYADKDAPDALKNMSPYNLAAINSAINTNKEQVYKDAAAGALDGMTQDQLSDYAAITKNTKAKVVKTYTAWCTDDDTRERHSVIWDMNGTSHDNVTFDEWKKYLSLYNHECFAIPNDKDGNKRLVQIIEDGRGFVITLVEYKPNSKTKTTAGKAEFLARAAAEGMTPEQIRTVCKVMGW